MPITKHPYMRSWLFLGLFSIVVTFFELVTPPFHFNFGIACSTDDYVYDVSCSNPIVDMSAECQSLINNRRIGQNKWWPLHRTRIIRPLILTPISFVFLNFPLLGYVENGNLEFELRLVHGRNTGCPFHEKMCLVLCLVMWTSYWNNELK